VSWIGRRNKQGEPDLIVEVQPTPFITRERITPYVDGARVRVETARGRVTPYVETAVGTAVERVTPYVGQARDWAGPKVEDAKHRAAPVVTGAVDKYGHLIESALEDASTKLTSVLESAAPAKEEVQRRGTAAVAALMGELDAPKPKSSHWVRRFMLVSLVTGLGAAAFAFFKRRKDDDAWITTDTPYPTYNSSAPSTSGAAETVTPVGGTSATAGSAGTDSVGTSSLGTDSLGTGSTGTDSIGTGSIGTGSIGTGSVETGTSGAVADDLVTDDSLGGLSTGLPGDEPLALAADDAGASPDEVVADSSLEFAAEPSTPDEPFERVTPKDVAEHIHPHRDN
jgi:hypothetical protein